MILCSASLSFRSSFTKVGRKFLPQLRAKLGDPNDPNVIRRVDPRRAGTGFLEFTTTHAYPRRYLCVRNHTEAEQIIARLSFKLISRFVQNIQLSVAWYWYV